MGGRRLFLAGVILMAGSYALGWVSLLLGGVTSTASYVSGRTPVTTLLANNIYVQAWFLSWIPFIAGFALAGVEGYSTVKQATRRLLRRR